ncbi:hypothetical protein [Piscinibacter sakaiensis]|uniref:hypothetical protein n=1 Tax=Piscinibacter sakaiensis TaxID=1547922 RepID=UPI003AAC4564
MKPDHLLDRSTNRLHRWLIYVVAATLSTGPVGATATPPAKLSPVPGMFTDMKYQQEFGDFVGMEIFIVPSGDGGHFALVQCSDGKLTKPVLVQASFKGIAVTLEPHRDPLSSCPKAAFRGTISDAELRGQFEGSSHVRRLKRKSSVWQLEDVLPGAK